MNFSVLWTTNPLFGGEPLPLLDLFLRLPAGQFQPFTFRVDSELQTHFETVEGG